jgi:chaperonin GroES
MLRRTIPVLKTLVPLGDRVLVQRVVTATETKSGVLLPESSVKKTNEGSVVEVGPGTKDHDMTVKKGDTVVLPEYGGVSLKVDDTEMFLYREAEILAVIKE